MNKAEKNPKHNLLVINGCGKIEGDIQTLLVALRGFEGDGFSTLVVSKPRGEVYERLREIAHIRIVPMEMGGIEALPSAGYNKRKQMIDFVSAILKMVRLIQQEKIDVIYTIDRGVAPQLGAIVSWLTKTPFVLNAAYPFYPQNGRMARFVLRQATRLHVHSRYLLNHLLPWVKDQSRFVIVPNGLELEHYDLSIHKETARKTFGVSMNEPVVVMMGRLNQYKGQDDLIKAAPCVLKQFPNAHFFISGRGDLAWKTHLEDLIAEYKLDPRVRLMGYVPDVAEFLATADVVVMPSWEEPFGLVALEGMAMAKPVIATNAGGVPEFVSDHQTGLLVEPRNPDTLAEAILWLLTYPEKAAQMGQNGRKVVEKKLTAQMYVEKVIEVIKSVEIKNAPGTTGRNKESTW